MLRRLLLAVLAYGFLSSIPADAQRISAYDSHTRVVAVVPVQGDGTESNPFRPKYFANPAVPGSPGLRLLGWAAVLSASRNLYIVECVAATRRDLGPLLADSTVIWWDKAVTPRATLETRLRELVPDASLERLRVRVR